jgi:hypothetical protein
VNCGSTKSACDQLGLDFQELNEQMMAAIRAAHATPAEPAQ